LAVIVAVDVAFGEEEDEGEDGDDAGAAGEDAVCIAAKGEV
jgi:hypothetical protein